MILLFGSAALPRTPHRVTALPPAFVPPPILMYHRVDVDRPADPVGRELTISPGQFTDQLAYLKSRGITGISMEQLRERLESGAPLDHVVVLTFDDGYADQYSYALPLLRRFHDDATFYVVTGTLGEPRHLSWPQLLAMRAFGEDIAAHGVEHEDLSLMSNAQQAAQIDDSVRVLRRRLRAAVTSYGYPSGRFNRVTLQLVQHAGVDLAVTTDRRYVIAPENRFELSRVRVRSGWTTAEFAQALRSALERAQIVHR
ncbi:MAG TPA: polysaccharide deacetylase family protein [Candidatus Baltobacteraceae bacterium]|nr:polysaccharide deacetylase family protein [Candidatus Baltobacteraceae bacterium]